MGRKRGGLAGLWDRSKNVIKPVATGLAGFFGTPLLGAAVGAAMGGLDRPGKSGIGFDAKGGALGGLSGYAMGSLGSAASGTALGQKLGGNALDKFGGSGLRGLLGSGTPAAAAPSAYAGTMAPEAVGDAYAGAGVAPPAGVPAATAPLSGVSGAPSAPTSLLGKLGKSVEKNPTAYAMGLQGLGSLATSGAQNRAADAEGRLTSAQADKIEYENKRKAESDETLKELRARLAQQLAQLTGGTGTAATPYGGYRS